MANDMARASLYISREKHEKLKDYCKSHGMTVNGLMKVLLDKYMREVEEEE